ncbi:MAG: hypothetical protein LDL26_00355 [Caenispirillum bisanense]|nr:hypothetical protein [Caenispirillum bisanense]
MGVYLIVGKPGSGKSFEAVRQWAFEAFKAGRKVITNLKLNEDVWRMFFPNVNVGELLEVRDGAGSFARPEHYGDPWRHPGLPPDHPMAASDHASEGKGPLYIIDECHKDLPSGATEKAVIHWFKEHRHEGADVVLMTQEPKDISRSILTLVQAGYFCTNHAGAGYDDRYSVEVRSGWRARDPKIGSALVRKYDPRYFPLYRSYSKGGAPGAETKVRSKPIHKRWWVKAAAILLLVSLFLTGKGIAGVVAKFSGGEAEQQQGAAEREAPAPVPAFAPARPAAAPAPVAMVAPVGPLDVVHRAPAGGRQAVAPALPPPPRHLFAGAQVAIGATLSVSGGVDDRPVVWISIKRGGQRYQVRADALGAMGWQFSVRGPCDVFVKGPGWTGVLTCEYQFVPA